MIRTRKLRTPDGTLVGEVPESLRKAMESGAESVTLTDAEEIERLQARVKQLEEAWRLEHSEVTMLRERLTRWAKVITKMYEQVTQEILF